MKKNILNNIDIYAKREYNNSKKRKMRIKGGGEMQIVECNAPVAKNIAGVIENKGLKQVYIAEKAGDSPQELNDMLNGRRLIKANDIARISLALGVDANYLFGIKKGE